MLQVDRSLYLIRIVNTSYTKEYTGWPMEIETNLRIIYFTDRKYSFNLMASTNNTRYC